MMRERRLHTCMLCEAVCGLSVEVEDNRVVSVRGDKDDPFSRGHICPKATAIADILDDPDRIRQPLRRVGTRFEPISWAEALDEAGRGLAEVQKRYGSNALGVYFGNPTFHSASASLGAMALSRLLNTRSRFSTASVDQLPHMLAALEMYGHQHLLPIADVDRTQYLLVLGANPIVSNGSLLTAGNIRARIDALKARGGRLVVLDPRLTETAAIATAHHFIRPGTDALLLLGLMQVVFDERLAQPGRLASMTEGFEHLQEIAALYPPERIATTVGLDAQNIRSVARDFAKAESAVCYGRMGTCAQEFGGLTAWLINALNIVTGNFDRAGGAMLTSPAVDVVGLTTRLGERGSFDSWRSRVRGLPEFGGELPVASIAEEIETEGDGQIKGLLTFAGNPVLSAPNGARLDRALSGLDFMVAIDIYQNETTRHANLILPTTFGFERPAFDAPYYMIAVRNVARWAPAIITAPQGVRDDWEVMLELAQVLMKYGGGLGGIKASLGLRLAKAIGPWRALDWLLRRGGRKLSLSKLAKCPHGVDLGPLESLLPDRLATPDKRIRLVPQIFSTRSTATVELSR